MDIGKNIRHLRLAREMTQEALADALSLSVQAISRYETGAAYPDIEMLPVIAGYFGVTVDELLGVNKELRKKRKEEYYHEYEALGGQENDFKEGNGNIDEKIALFRKAHAEFPDDFEILYDLIRVLSRKDKDEGCLAEMRKLATEAAEKSADNNMTDNWRENLIIGYMVSEPDAATAERFAFKWGANQDISVESLLWCRFNPYRGDGDCERTRGLHQKRMLKSLTNGFYQLTTQISCGGIVDNGLNLLDFIGKLSHNPEIDKPDMWADEKIARITRIANSMFVLQRNEDAFALLDQAVRLVENMLALPDGTELDYGNDSYWRLASTTESAVWELPDWKYRYLKMIYKTPLYESVEIDLKEIDDEFFFAEFRPSHFLWNLRSAFESDGWPGFYMVRDEPRYREICARLREIITVKE